MRPIVVRRPGTAVPAMLLALLFAAGCTGAGASPSPTAAPATPVSTAAVTEAPSPSPTAPAFPAAITDDEGTAVTISAQPKKIVSLTPAATEILYAIGAGPSVVGKVEDIASYPPAAASIPVVATYKGVDVEKIVSLGADLVISGGAAFGQGDADDQLRKANIPVVVVGPTTTSGVLKDIRFVGQATGESANASALADAMSTAFATVQSLTAGVAHPKVFYETGNDPALYGIADGSLYAEMITLAGGTPITTGSTTNYEEPLEKLVAANPDIILLGDAAYGVTADQVKKRAGWGTIAAVQDGAIFPVDDTVITRPGPRLLAGLLSLLTAIHPEIVVPSLPPLSLGGAAAPTP
ncbi:MAG TPA: ABC transporter substrate-binding protein [Candidatus Limnocylindrales bacterium]|nr:ABC transporter substrate-binding protein [Candidatus Limnocylindrales bacterium]